MQANLISKKQARRLALLRQGLLRKQAFGKGLSASYQAIQRLSYLQIDTISVINRTHHHVLWTRVPSYEKDHLNRLLVEKKQLFEYWSHAAAYLPMDDFRYSLPRKQALQSGENHWHQRDPKLMQFVLDRISAEGPLQAKDFKAPEGFRATEMWSWKPAKIALEQLFMEGKLMIKERKSFQKVFDLTERVLPPEVDMKIPSPVEMATYLALRTVDSIGIATVREIGYLRKAKRKIGLQEALAILVENKELIQIEFAGEVHFTRPEFVEKSSIRLLNKQLHLLSPFDNLFIQRKRLEKLFDFSYQIECYTPAAKRQYGYFVLPILWGDEMVGRLDPKADKKQQTLFIRNLVFEPHALVDDELLTALAAKLKALATFNQCEHLVVEKAFPAVGKELERLFKKL